ncbi:MAG: hypothetical protein JNM68_09680 [Dinghuibacter sp.]|nr:hypothetical protein [Dinghuibacter sp.]
MKKILFLMIASVIINEATAQTSGPETAKIEEKITLLAKAFQEKKIDHIKPHFTEDIDVAGYKGNDAVDVLNSAFQQFPPIDSITLKKVEKTDAGYLVDIVLNTKVKVMDRSLLLDKEFRYKAINLFQAVIKNKKD